jgi:hypothetical protein
MDYRGKVSGCKDLRLSKWQQQEPSEIESVLEHKSDSLQVLKLALDESLAKKCQLEGDFRRARLEFVDWQVLYAQSVQVVDKLKSAKTSLR